MITAIIATNVVIALACFYLAWKIWQMKGFLARAANRLTAYERATRRGLAVSPPAILWAQRGTYQLRQRYRGLEPQVEKLRQVLLLLGWASGWWSQMARGNRKSSIKKYSNKLS
ncbi:hypothetical protein BST81_23065 [Leptolyngbya sp. 'hensonii']|uniref:hypothetical protein n=1 Tax=Leptolyngbya sp. 'hensonii' TaxID=1922337 RepID=UPI00094F75CF|nr:hypothetical protein [Leptolyngbya sp. 'hensonii']OLP16108.1 hypothetical protein BST81_23065 [Leptolyngbya sp. 'hensonii']